MSAEQPTPRRRAVALTYDALVDAAPRVVATGEGVIADKIIELARQHGVPLTEDPVLAQALIKLAPGQQIPVEVYQAVAEIIVFIYRMRGQKLPRP